MIEPHPMTLHYLFNFAAGAFVIALLATPLVRSLAFRLRAVDRGEGRRSHLGVIPRLGGVAIYLAIVVPLLAMVATRPESLFNHRLIGIILTGSIVFAAGVYDDIRGLSVRAKLAVEVLAAVLLFAWGVRVATISSPFGGFVVFDVLSLPLTILWMIVITNAINLIDGLDGLAASTGILIAATLVLLPGTRAPESGIVPLVVAAALLGFLRHNFPPASIFMGDSGSLFLGYFLAAMSILLSSKATAVATMMVPMIAFVHPIMDMGYAVMRRLYRGVPLGRPDREHIHHKLLDRGLSRKLVLTVLVVMNALLLLGTWFIVHRQWGSDFLLLALLVVAFVAGLRLFGYIEFSKVFRGDFRLLLMNRKRRYVLFLVRQFRHQVADSRSVDDLKTPVARLLTETGYDKAVLTLKTDGSGERQIEFNRERGDADAADAGAGVRTSFPVIRDGAEVGRCDLVAAAGVTSPLDAADIAVAVSEAVLKVE